MNSRKPSSPDRTELFPLTVSLLLGALGQWFLGRREEPSTLYWGLAFYLPALALWVLSNRSSGTKAPVSINARLEGLLFSIIILLAAFFRFYRLDEFPPGIFPDIATEGLGALRILHEHWRPLYEIYQLLVWDPALVYQLAIWFKFFNHTAFNLFFFTTLISLASFPLVYWTFRQWAGSVTALTGLFIMAVMRWDWVYSRDGHPAVQLPFYMFGTLAFWTYGLKTGKRWAYGVAALFFAGGFYIYQAYKAFIPLMVLYALYEAFWSKPKARITGKDLTLFFILSLALASPIWSYWLMKGSLGPREAALFILPQFLKEGNILPLLGHLARTVLMFNREGDSWFLNNIPYHRMLDDVTALFLVFGVVMALRRPRERAVFYTIGGLAFMCLPAFLSVAATHASRSFGAVPFVAFLAALPLAALGERSWGGSRQGRPGTLGFLAAGLMLGMAFQNFRTYFHDQIGNYDCWMGSGADTAAVGKRIDQLGNGYEYFLSAHFAGQNCVEFLSYFQRDHTHKLDLSRLPSPGPTQPLRGFWFALEEGQTGILDFLKEVYPGGTTEAVKNPWGHAIVHFYRVDPGILSRLPAWKHAPSGGLKGTYFLSPDFTGPLTLVNLDPLLNFTFRENFPLRQFTQLSVKWEGSLKVKVPGSYRFLTLTTDQATLQLDGKTLFNQGNQESGDFFLKKGPHHLRLLFQKSSGLNTALTLVWKKPGETKFEVVPYSALSH